MAATQETFPTVCDYLAEYNFALENSRELPVMNDERLTPSEQVRIGRFLLKADPQARTVQRHYRQMHQPGTSTNGNS